MLKRINKALESILARIGIKELFIALFVVFLVIIIGAFFVSRYKTIYQTIYHERTTKLKYVDDFVIEILRDESDAVSRNKKTLRQAQDEVIGIIKDVHFEKDDYIWITHYNGIVIYHPYKTLIGTYTKDFKDINGYNFGAKLIDIPKQYGSGYVKYYWPKPGRDRNEIYPKLSYVVAFPDWQWVIGTGVYIDDIKVKVLKTMFDGFMPVFLVCLLFVFVFRYVIWATIVNPIENLVDKSLKLADNDLSVTVPMQNHNTEFGKLYRAFNKFVEFFKEKRNNEENLSLIHNNIDDVLLTVSEDGFVQSVNPAIEKMFAYSQEEVIGMHVDSLISPTLFESDETECSKMHFTGKYELLGIKKTEDFFDVEVNINKFSKDEATMFILLIRDITEQKAVEKMKNDFISVVSHELRTPLTSIRGSIGLLLCGNFSAITGKVRELLEVAEGNCVRLITLINDILDIEQMAAGKMKFDYENTRISEIIENTILMNKAYADKFKVQYKFINNLEPDEYFCVDRNRFSQILTNLLSNAAKFSPENDVVIVSADYNGNFIRVSVEDNGPGIPIDYKDKMFSKFSQADSSDARRKGGTGLGLNICKNLAEKMGGHIGFESDLGQGTTFYIDLPTSKNVHRV